MIKIRLLYLGLLLVIMAACSSGRKALDTGNYEDAVFKAVNRLRSSPGNQKAAATLRQAYPLATQWHLNRVSQLTNSGEVFKWEKIIDSYTILQRMGEEISRCPACLRNIPNPGSYINEIGEARINAADERYQAGENALKSNTREGAREAYYHFIKADEFVPNYRGDVRNKIETAREYATLRVVVEQIPVNSRMYQLSSMFFQQKIFEYISSNRRMNDFVRFYTPQQASAEDLRYPDHIIRMQFDDFVVGETHTERVEKEVSRDSVKIGEVSDASGQKKPVYGKVSATMISCKKMIRSRRLLDLQIYEPRSNQVIFQEKMPGEFVWASEWGTFKGDERALTQQQKELCNRREATPPPPQDLFVEFCRPIYDQATGTIRRFYKNY